MLRFQKLRMQCLFALLPVLISVSAIVSTAQTVKPYVISHPLKAELVVGDTLKLTVSCGGSFPRTYQWYDLTNMPVNGASDSVFRKFPVTLQDNNKGYYCIISNSAGSVSSGTGLVKVKRPSSDLINVTGELYTHDGTVIGYPSEVIKDIIVYLYPSVSSTTPVYSEAFRQSDGYGVKVIQSKFSVNLGGGITNDTLRNIVRMYPDIFIEFRVCSPGGIPEIMSPRLPLTSAPYSLSGTPELITGNVDPVSAGISAPIGTHYLNKSTGKTFIKTNNSWVTLD
jgi:hypothetical protein